MAERQRQVRRHHRSNYSPRRSRHSLSQSEYGNVSASGYPDHHSVQPQHDIVYDHFEVSAAAAASEQPSRDYFRYDSHHPRRESHSDHYFQQRSHHSDEHNIVRGHHATSSMSHSHNSDHGHHHPHAQSWQSRQQESGSAHRQSGLDHFENAPAAVTVTVETDSEAEAEADMFALEIYGGDGRGGGASAASALAVDYFTNYEADHATVNRNSMEHTSDEDEPRAGPGPVVPALHLHSISPVNLAATERRGYRSHLPSHVSISTLDQTLQKLPPTDAKSKASPEAESDPADDFKYLKSTQRLCGVVSLIIVAFISIAVVAYVLISDMNDNRTLQLIIAIPVSLYAILVLGILWWIATKASRTNPNNALCSPIVSTHCWASTTGLLRLCATFGALFISLLVVLAILLLAFDSESVSDSESGVNPDQTPFALLVGAGVILIFVSMCCYGTYCNVPVWMYKIDDD
jgi:hypothetical protein